MRKVPGVICPIYGHTNIVLLDPANCEHDKAKRIYSDEHQMCGGVLAFDRARKCKAEQPGFPGIYAATQWLKLI